MYYKVVEEVCDNGTKSRFLIGQIVNSNDIENVKDSFADNFRDMYEDRLKLKLEFYRLGIFNDRENLYKIVLDKLR